MSNNKQTMKLYTEEQVQSAMLLALGRHGIYIPNKHYQDLIDSLTPIELPSDEEIEEEMNNEYPLTGHVGIDHRNYLRKVGYNQGAKYVINKIQGGNNEQQ